MNTAFDAIVISAPLGQNLILGLFAIQMVVKLVDIPSKSKTRKSITGDSKFYNDHDDPRFPEALIYQNTTQRDCQ